MTAWLWAFALTQLFEVPVYRRFGAGWVAAFGASALTHPVVWFVFPWLLRPALGYWAMVGVAEGFAVAAEALWLWRWRVPQPFALSVLANAVSFGGGLLLRYGFGVV